MGGGGSQCRMLSLRNGNVACLRGNFPQYHVSNFINEYVAYHYIFSPHVACHYALCHMWNLRNAHVALSILGLKGHLENSEWSPGKPRRKNSFSRARSLFVNRAT